MKVKTPVLRTTIHMDGMAVLAFVNSHAPQQIHALLDKNHTFFDGLVLIIFQQANKVIMDSLTRILKVPLE